MAAGVNEIESWNRSFDSEDHRAWGAEQALHVF